MLGDRQQRAQFRETSRGTLTTSTSSTASLSSSGELDMSDSEEQRRRDDEANDNTGDDIRLGVPEARRMTSEISSATNSTLSSTESIAITVHHENLHSALLSIRSADMDDGDDSSVVLTGDGDLAEDEQAFSRPFLDLQRTMSELTPPSSPTPHEAAGEREEVGCTTPEAVRLNGGSVPRSYGATPQRTNSTKKKGMNGISRRESSQSSTENGAEYLHETLHAQSLLLAIAFLLVWSPQNLMAPNLTQMADYFHFNDNQRDVYLGANIAFATGVLSLPVSALIGFVADVVPSRKKLYALTVFVGGVSSLCTGWSRTYPQLYAARFVNGGCMSGSVPIAFSLLGDLFDAKDRNAASSGLTAMMGAGIILGQVYAGTVGDRLGWKHPFYLSGASTVVSALLVLRFVKEPVRGGKEKVLQDMLKRGTKYERKLTVKGFLHAMRHNASNVIIMWQGFFSSVPWGIIFTFLNDYLSQERGLSVPDATVLVFWFGIGCALGGVLGGYLGQVTTQMNRSYMPLFMAFTTFLGIAPFLGLLNGNFHSANLISSFYAFAGGSIASLPSVNVRPCLINVNPPETRGAALTAANLIINFARGAGPSFITVTGAIWDVSRQFSFNLTLIVFWTITAIQLCFLAKTLPRDQDAMEAELAQYAASEINRANGGDGRESVCSVYDDDNTVAGNESLVSIEERMRSFDADAAKETWSFLGESFREIGDEWRHRRQVRNDYEQIAGDDHPPNGTPLKHGHGRRAQFKSQQMSSETMAEWVKSPPSHRTKSLNDVIADLDFPRTSDIVSPISDVSLDRGPVIDADRGKQPNSFSNRSETLL